MSKCMSKWMKISLAAVMVLGLLAGCGKSGQPESQETLESNLQTESAGVDSTTESGTEESVSEETAAMHCLLLKGENDTWLFADRDYGTLFYAPVPEQLTDASGKQLAKDDLKAGNQIDVYGNGIMLQSYPGQYPGVTQMVVTAEGSEEDLAEYQELIDQFFPEPDMSQPPQLNISYTTSLANTTVVLSGPGNYTWTTPSEEDGESNEVTACGPAVIQWENLIDITPEGKTDVRLLSEVKPDQVKVCRWPVSDYMTENYDHMEDVAVETDDSGSYILKDVEEGYIYSILAGWEMGEAEYGFVAGQLPE